MSFADPSQPDPKADRSDERVEPSVPDDSGKGFWWRLGSGIPRTAQSLVDLLSGPLPDRLRGRFGRSIAKTGKAGPPRLSTLGQAGRKVTIEGFWAGLLPSGLDVDTENHLGGELVLHRTSINCRVWSSGIQPALERAAAKLLASAVRISSEGGKALELAYHTDLELTRLQIRFPNGFSSGRQPFGKIVTEMREFAGSDPAVRVLSAVVHSRLLLPLEYLETVEGEPLTFAAPLPSLEGEAIANYRFIDRQGVTHDLGSKPGRYSAATFVLERSQEGNMLITLDWPLYASGFRAVGQTNPAPLGGNDYLMKLHYRSQWQLDQAAADHGRIQLSILRPVTVAFEGLIRE